MFTANGNEICNILLYTSKWIFLLDNFRLKSLNQMPTPHSNSGLRDNHTRGTVADFLKGEIRDGSRLSVVSAYFTIYAYDALKDCLDRIDHLDFLFGEPSFVNRLDPSKTEKKSFIIDADGLELANKLQQKRVAKECADWIERKVDIKTIKQSNLLHGKMYYVATAGVEEAILGSSNFTVRGLGLGNGNNNIELNLIVDGNRDRQELKQWFDELWSHPNLVKDVKQEVLQYLKQLYENNAPEFIYYKTLFHIFEKFLDDTGKTDAELGQTSLFETEIWQALFEFQKDGVKGAINKILRHNGCVVADSVGLGKTYEALAVIKYFELKNERVLVLCPKRLWENWTVYKANSRLNPFLADRFRYDMLAHTDLSRERGYSGDINLETLNWGNYDIGMMKVNFLKRLESCVKSFEITMDRTIAKIESLEKKIRNFQALPSKMPNRMNWNSTSGTLDWMKNWKMHCLSAGNSHTNSGTCG